MSGIDRRYRRPLRLGLRGVRCVDHPGGVLQGSELHADKLLGPLSAISRSPKSSSAISTRVSDPSSSIVSTTKSTRRSTPCPTWSLSLASSIGRSIWEVVLREYVASAIDEAAQGPYRPEVPPMGAGRARNPKGERGARKEDCSHSEHRTWLSRAGGRMCM